MAILKTSGVGAAVTDSATLDTRRINNFGDEVADLAPDETPFFVYLSKVAKKPTDDPLFRILENRTKINWSNRNGTCGVLQATDVETGDNITTGESTVGDTVYFNQTTAVGVTLIPGMVLMVERVVSSVPKPLYIRIDSAGSTADWSCTVVGNSGNEDAANSASSPWQVVGTAFGEGTSSPQFFSDKLDDTYGLTQIFKTSCYMSGSAMATRYRGYQDEWDRIWNQKLREHKVDIERALLFGQKASTGSVQYTDGIIGHILKNVGTEGSALQSDDDVTDFSYEDSSPYVREIAYSSMTYDRFLSDLEVFFDSARGGSKSKLVLAGLPTITWLNKVGATGFMDVSVAGNSALNYNMDSRTGAFGHKILTIETVHGDLHVVKDPLLRGIAANYMAMVDLDNVKYRPLVGNGLNRDTHIISNVQTPDEDSRKDIILTESGLAVTLPESHGLYVFS